ncbi:hypothetical protein [Polaromonas sp. CG9_12]|nr:hypothetical protein [Polaromonas sp. CG9_12]
MAAFKTTSVVLSRADQPNIVHRFLSTSERFLFNPAEVASVRIWVHPELRAQARAAT